MKRRFATQYDRLPQTFEQNDGTSMTVQGQEMSVAEVIRNFTNGIPIYSYGKDMNDDEVNELDYYADFDQMDRFEQMQTMRDLEHDLSELRRRSSEPQAQEPVTEGEGRPQESESPQPTTQTE